ncbi:MAG: hypothetical protein FJZ87_03710 [Chloroflexi bacterium]|nr:hypothetical protein [Chloroflexota bacterium]
MKRYLYVFPALLTAGLACTFGGSIPAEEGTSVTPEETILYQDDFSTNSGGWPEFDDPQGTTSYYNGGYRIHVTGAEWDYFGSPTIENTPADVIVEVDTTKHGGPIQNKFGIVCRLSDTPEGSNMYYLWISTQQYSAIGKFVNSKRTFLTDIEIWSPNPAIHPGEAINHIRGECIGNTLSLYANGTLLLQATDDQFTEGKVGLISGSYKEGYEGTDILFENFVVKTP